MKAVTVLVGTLLLILTNPALARRHHYVSAPAAECVESVMRPCYMTQATSAVQQRVSRRPERRVVEPFSGGGGSGIVRAASGATAHVAAHATSQFQCLVMALERQGYPVRVLGGFARGGRVRGSLHYSGHALDVNQVARNVTRPSMPSNEIALANGCGLISGAQWGHADSGHFQLGGYAGNGNHHARRHVRHVRYARLHGRGRR